MWTELAVAAISTGGALGGTWLGAFLNRRSALDTAKQMVDLERHKYAQSRLWDAQKDAYTAIVAELHVLDKCIDKMYQCCFDLEVDPDDYINSTYFNDDHKALWQSYRRFKSFIQDNVLIVSETFQAEVGAWEQEFFYYDEQDEPPEVVRAHRTAMGKHKNVLVNMAKSELAATPKE